MCVPALWRRGWLLLSKLSSISTIVGAGLSILGDEEVGTMVDSVVVVVEVVVFGVVVVVVVVVEAVVVKEVVGSSSLSSGWAVFISRFSRTSSVSASSDWLPLIWWTL